MPALPTPVLPKSIPHGPHPLATSVRVSPPLIEAARVETGAVLQKLRASKTGISEEVAPPMPKTHRRRADRDQFWRDTIAAWKESGQTVTAFCAARGLGESTFFAKRRELAQRDQSPNTPNSPSPSALFAEVRVVPDPTVEIVVPGGVVLRVPVGADAAAVARLVLALRGAPC